MDHTFVDAKSLKTLEDYAVFLAGAMLTFQTLLNFQIRAIEIGIMPEDMNERANTMIWDLRRLVKLYSEQTAASLELVGDDFDHQAVIETMKRKQLTRARAMLKKDRPKVG